MKNTIAWLLVIVTILISCLFVGCGVSQEEYDLVSAQLRASQAQVNELQAQVIGLQIEISELKEQYEIVGKTPIETAENIVKHYHEMHIYSEYDFFVCSDMALDVWDMLKAQGINALIQIGNVETEAKDITEANHAWVLAEVSPEEYLALETTGGYAVRDNSLYYKGWSFDNPREYKRFVEIRHEYNIRVKIANQLIDISQKTYAEYENENNRYLELVDEFNERYVGRPVSLEAFNYRDKIEAQLAIVKEREGRYNQLNELVSEQKQELENLVSEMKGLTN